MADMQTGLYQPDEQKRNKKALMDQMTDTPPAGGGMPTQPYDPAAPPSSLASSYGPVDLPPNEPGMPTQPLTAPPAADVPPVISDPAAGAPPAPPTPPVPPTPGQKPEVPANAPVTPIPPNQPGSGPTAPPAPSAPPPQAPYVPGQPPSAINGDLYRQGQEKQLRDALIAQMSQGTDVSADDPNIKAQLDPFRAEQERARREAVNRGAESAFASGQDFGAPEQAMAAERMGEAMGLRASELVGKELTAKRDEIQKALQQFGGMMDADQKDKLTRDLASLDAQLKREGFGLEAGQGDLNRQLQKYMADQETNTKIKALDSESGWRTYIANLEAKSREEALREGGRQADQQNTLDRYKSDQAFASAKYQTDRGFDMDKLRLDADNFIKKLGLEQTGTLANRELDIRDKLGMAGMNAEMTRMLLQDKQFRDRLGFDISKWQGDMNRDAVIAQLQG